VRDEPLPADSPLWTTPGVRISPHSASDHRGSYRGGFDIFCENLAALRDGRPLRNLVDISGR
jgi:phosphoglycerate dehydrogenase-like enzyme